MKIGLGQLSRDNLSRIGSCPVREEGQVASTTSSTIQQTAPILAIYLSPAFDPNGVTGVPPGNGKVRLRGLEIRDGIYHGWIERDDPRRMSRLGFSEPLDFPVLPGRCVVCRRVDGELPRLRPLDHLCRKLRRGRSRINITGSQGPTRDGRFKPDVAAVGTDVVAAKGFMDSNDQWVAMGQRRALVRPGISVCRRHRGTDAGDKTGN